MLIKFQGHLIKYGGVFPSEIIRLFKYGFAFCENRLMDEKFVIKGNSTSLKNELIDHNLKSFSWWLQKHNSYSSKEAIEMLDLEFNFLEKNLNKKLNKTSSI